MIISVIIFTGLFISFDLFFKSQALERFIWEINTFHGMFANLPNDLPKDDIVGSYAYEFKDYDAHAPRTLATNAVYYALLHAFFLSLLVSQSLCKKMNLWHFRRLSVYSLIIFGGLFTRFFFAYHTTGNHDMASWYINKSVLEAGQNIFAVTDRYNYSPFWFLILKFLNSVNHLFSQFPFMFIIRSFLTVIDLFSTLFIVLIAKKMNVSGLVAAALFFLNPITVIITGYHGQFDNIPILFLLCAIYFFLRFGNKSVLLGWALITIGMIAKHEILQQILIFLRQAQVKKKMTFFLFTFSVFLFLISFAPYWKEGSERILRNVLYYGGMNRPYGFIHFHTNLLLALIHKFLFISFLFVWPFICKVRDLVKSSLTGMLFFLVFTSGISTQQFILPIALGALRPNVGFFLFTTAASFLLFGSIDELKIQYFNVMTWDYVWFCSFIWFLVELQKNNFKAENRKQSLNLITS